MDPVVDKYDREACLELYYKAKLLMLYEQETGETAVWPADLPEAETRVERIGNLKRATDLSESKSRS